MTELEALEAYSTGRMTALELRRRLAHLPLPRAPVEGCEAHHGKKPGH